LPEIDKRTAHYPILLKQRMVHQHFQTKPLLHNDFHENE